MCTGSCTFISLTAPRCHCSPAAFMSLSATIGSSASGKHTVKRKGGLHLAKTNSVFRQRTLLMTGGLHLAKTYCVLRQQTHYHQKGKWHLAGTNCVLLVVTQGMLQSAALGKFYLDLQNEAYTTAFAIYHRRFSTNTTPKWPLAQPMRFLGHNGRSSRRPVGSACTHSPLRVSKHVWYNRLVLTHSA